MCTHTPMSPRRPPQLAPSQISVTPSLTLTLLVISSTSTCLAPGPTSLGQLEGVIQDLHILMHAQGVDRHSFLD